MKSRIFSLCLVILGCIAVLCSCLVGGTGNNGGDFIWNKKSELYITVGDNDAGALVDELYNDITLARGNSLYVQGGSAPEQPHEIVVGETDRKISRDAYAALNAISCTDDELAYLIYTDGKSVAIAYDKSDDKLAMIAVFEYFAAN